jgi:hypothetical protein
MRINIRGGTVSEGEPSLCQTCRYATIIKGTTQKHEIVECGRLAEVRNRITFAVTSCTSYSDRRHASIWEMQEMAWVLRSDPKRNQIGFVRPRSSRLAERIVLEDD